MEADVGRLGAEYAGRLSAARRIGEVQFSNEARSLYQALYPDLTADHGGLYGVVTARAEAQVIRLALTYALLDGSNLISVQHLMAALAVWEFCDNSARYLFGEAQPDPIEARILALLKTGPKTTSELHRARSGHIPVEKMKAALANLQGRGRIDQINEPTPGRPRAIWTLRQGFQRERSEKGEIRRAHEPYFALLA